MDQTIPNKTPENSSYFVDSVACNHCRAVFRLRNGCVEESIGGQVGLFGYGTRPS